MDTLKLRIYPGANGQFMLYSDKRDNDNYEKGTYKVVPFQWDDKQKTHTTDMHQGTYPGAIKNIYLILFG